MKSIRLYLRILVLFGGISLNSHVQCVAGDSDSTRIAIVGASVGKAWQLDEFPVRAGREDLVVECMGCFSFDKEPLIASLAARGADTRPDYLVVKECAAYFPGKLDSYSTSVSAWVAKCRSAGIEPVLATVIPVSGWRARQERLGFLQRVRTWLRDHLKYGGQSQIEGITLYNQWVRTFASEEGLLVLDLAAALIDSTDGMYLAAEYDGGDGLHLNDSAYRRLDDALGELLARLPARPGD